MLLPGNLIVKNQKVLVSEDMTADYRRKGVPLCDLIDVKDLVLLAETYPDLILKIVQKLVAAPHVKTSLVGKWMKQIKRYNVRGSSECYPRAKAKTDGSKGVIKFWDHSDESIHKFPANAIEVAVETAILPLRDVLLLFIIFLKYDSFFSLYFFFSFLLFFLLSFVFSFFFFLFFLLLFVALVIPLGSLLFVFASFFLVAYVL